MKEKSPALYILSALFLLVPGVCSSVAQADTVCYIVWSDNAGGGGIISTQETSRTQQATYEIFEEVQLYNIAPDYCNSSSGAYCCYGRVYMGLFIVDTKTCQNGYYEVIITPHPLSEKRSEISPTNTGTWDVVCCTDDDGDGYYAGGSICGEEDCDDTDPGVNPGATEKCGGGIDEDCDGDIDCADSDCADDYSCTANAEASTYGSNALTGSGISNELLLLIIPIGAVILLRIIRRKT